MAENNKTFTDHLSDFGEGITSFFVTAYNFGDFLGRISGPRDLQQQRCAKRLLSTRGY